MLSPYINRREVSTCGCDSASAGTTAALSPKFDLYGGDES